MSENIASLGAVADPTYGQGQHPNAAPDHPDKPESEADPHDSDPADPRLIIEGDAEHGELVYKVVDGRTAVVVKALAPDQLLHMREESNYVAGQVIKTRV